MPDALLILAGWCLFGMGVVGYLWWAFLRRLDECYPLTKRCPWDGTAWRMVFICGWMWPVVIALDIFTPWPEGRRGTTAGRAKAKTRHEALRAAFPNAKELR